MALEDQKKNQNVFQSALNYAKQQAVQRVGVQSTEHAKPVKPVKPVQSNSIQQTVQNAMGYAKRQALNAVQPTTSAAPSYTPKMIDPVVKQTTRGTLASIQQMNQTNPTGARSAMDMLKQLQSDPSSRYFNPYKKATNRAVDALAELGFDVSNIDDNWFDQNAWLKQYYVPTANTNSLSTTMTGKKSTPEQQAAYYYNQLDRTRADTQAAKSEREKLNKYVSYWAAQKDRNYSDDEILGMIGWKDGSPTEKFKKDYPTLYKMEMTRRQGTPMELNSAVDFSLDGLYGTMWAARNGGSTGNPYQDMINSVTENNYTDNAEIRAKLDPNSDQFSIYSVGSTMTKEREHFGRSSFDQKWLDDNKHLLTDGTEDDQKYYKSVYAAEQDTVSAENAVTSLKARIDSMLASGAYSEEMILKRLDTLLDKDEYKILNKMDDSLDKGFDIINTTRKVDYRKQDMVAYIHNACTENGKKQSAVDMAGEIYGAQPESSSAAVSTASVGTAAQTPGAASPSPVDTAASVAAATPVPGGSPTPAVTPAPVGTASSPVDTAAPASTGVQTRRGVQDIMADAAALAGITVPAQQDINPEAIEKLRAAYDQKNGAGSFDADLTAAMSRNATRQPSLTQGPSAPQVIPGARGTAAQSTAPTLSDKSRSIAGKIPEGVTLLSQAELDEMKLKDHNAAEASVALSGKTTGTEAAYLTYSSQGSKPVQDYLNGASTEDLAGANILSLCQNYSGEMIPLIISNTATEKAKANLQDAQTRLPVVRETIDGIRRNAIYSTLNQYRGTDAVAELVWDANTLMLDEDASDWEKEDALMELYYQVSGGHDYYPELDTADKAQMAQEWLYYLNGGGETIEAAAPTQEEISSLTELRKLDSRYQQIISDSEQTIADNAESEKKYNEQRLWMDSTIEAYEEAGIDATDLKAAKVVADYVGSANEYQSMNWGTESYYQGVADRHKAFPTMSPDAEAEHKNNQEALINIRWVLDYIQKNGIKLPDSAQAKLNAQLQDLELGEKDYQYYMKQFEPGFADKAEQGRKAEKEVYNFWTDGAAFGALRDDKAKKSWNIAGGLDQAYYSQFMDPVQKDTFYNMYKEGGREAAWEYYKFLAYDTRILQNKDVKNVEAQAANETGSGVLSGIWANMKAIGGASLEGIAGLAYTLESALGAAVDPNYQINPTDRRLNTAKYAAKVYESTLNAIHNEFAESAPILDGVLSTVYEGVYNNSRSLVNSLTFGRLTRAISNPVIQGILGATNMGFGAMATTIADATEKGATSGQALALGGITFLAETFSEGLTASNIHSMVTGIRAGSPASVKAAIVDWLKQEGFEEAAGEVANSLIENWADASIMGDASEHAARVNAWYEKLKEENPGLDDELIRQRAEDEAEKDELTGYLHTALVSFLSPGLNVVTGLVKSSAERVMDYRRVSNAFQEAGIDIGIKEVREMYKARDEQLNNPKTAAKKALTAPAAGDIRLANPATNPVNPAVSQDDTFARDASILNSVAGKSSPVGTAALSSILYDGKERRSTAAAKAAAVNLNRTLGSAENAINTVKTLLAGAKTSGVSSGSIKTAIQIAALAPHSKTALFLNSEAFQTATPAQKAQVLANLGRQDASSGAVLAEMNGSVQEGIKADFVAAILAEGAGKAAVEAQAKIDAARKQTKRAEKTLEEKQADLKKATDAVKAAEEEVQRDPKAGAPLMSDALHKVATADAVEKQQAQSLEAQRENEEKVKETEGQKIDDTMTAVRDQADQNFDQMEEEDRKLEEERQLLEKQRQIEQKALQDAEDAESGKTSEDQDTEAIDSFLDSYGYEGEERETEKQKMLALREQVKYNKFVNSNVNTPEGFMAVSSFSRKLGLQIKLEDLGDPTVIRGKYENGVVYLNRNRMRNGDYTVGQAMVEAALHEITHSMESTKSYEAYRGAVLGSLFNAESAGTTESLYAENAAYRAAIDQKIADYKKVGKELSVPDAEKEIVADFARTHLNDRDTVSRLIDRGLGWKMRATLHNINEAIGNFYGQLKGEDRAQAEYLRRAERTFQKMMNEVAKQEIHPEGSQFSIAQIAQSTGMVFNEDTLELYDSNGHVVDGVNYRITPDMIQQTPVGMLILNGLSDQSPGLDENGNEKPSPQAAAMEMMAGLMNMVARYKDSDLVWEIGASTLSSTFSALKSNSDPQYATTVDFGTVCAKTQAIIDVLSQVMLERVREGKSGGLTREDIMKVYDATHNAGLSVPCPVCYVFSRWMGVPSLLGQMSQYQHDYVVTKENGSVDREETQKKVDAYLQNAEKYGDAKAINKRKTKLQGDLVKLEEQESAASPEDAKALREKMAAVKAQLDEVDAYNWITQALCKRDKNTGKYTVDPKFQVTPDEILFDLNRTGDFAKYEKNWRYRNTRGAGMGKAIMPYGGETIGDILYGVKAKGRQDVLKNPWLNMDPKAAARQLAQARTRARKQNLVGGQRLQSTSDFRPEWGLDYLMSFLELQAAGSKVQMYTKVPEAVDFFASVGADVNLSIMGKGQGWHVDENGNQVLDFSSITGMDYETAKALKNKYDNVQMILVGMNDTHIRLAMANEDIDFIIPWHSSGNSQDTLKTLIGTLGEKLLTGVDYTTTQTDMVKGTVKKYTDENGNKVEYTVPGKQTAEEKALWDARVKLLTKGGDALTQAERSTLLSNPYTADLYKRFTEKGVDPDCYGVRLNKSQAEQIFPYEYWDTASTKDNADINGKRFVEYCEAMGIVPRFSQFKDDPGYWKLLIDRPMYNNDGSYHQQQTIDVTGARIGSLDENGKLTGSDLPKNVKTAKYATNDPRSEHYKDYTEKERQAKETALALLDKQYDAGTPAQLSAFGDQTEADRAMLQEAAQDYQSAVERGDMKAAAEDVESYAASRGYTEKVFHGTPNFGFTTFDMENSQGEIFVAYDDTLAATYTRTSATVRNISDTGKSISDMSTEDLWLYADENLKTITDENGDKWRVKVFPNSDGTFKLRMKELGFGSGIPTERTITREELEQYLSGRYEKTSKEGIYQLYTRPGNQLVVDAEDNAWNNIPFNGGTATTREIAEWAKDNGYDSVRISNVFDNGGRSYRRADGMDGYGDIGIFFNPEDVKSADPVTYDDQGNVIPLEKRFNDQTGDIRYSSGGDQTEADLALETNFDTMFDDLTTEELNELFDFGEETSEEEARQKLTVAVQDLKDEFDPTIYNGRLYVKPETLDYWLSGQGFASTSPGYAQAYITMMDPADFLRMTTATEAGQQAVLDSSHRLNDEELGENATRQPIQLLIDESAGKVTGHEGRHRAVALARAGVTQMPVLLFDSATKYSKTAKDSLTLEGQNPYFQDGVENGNTLTFTDVIPLSSGNADTIREQFTASEADRQVAGQNGQRIVQYSSGGDQTEADMALSTDADRMNNLINMGVLTQQEADEYNALSNPDGGRAQRQFGSQTAQESDALHDEVKEYLRNHSGYNPDSNQEQINRAISWVRERANENDPDGYRAAVDAVTSDDFDFRSADGQAQMLTVMSMAAMKNDIDSEMRLADAFNRQGTDLGRALQARKIFRLMTPIGRKAYLQKQVDSLNADIGKKTGKTGTISIDPWLLEAAGAAENEEDFRRVREAVAKQVGEQIPANWKDKLRSWRMLAMLGNPRTHIRNIIGNAMFIPAVSIKNKLGAVMELGLEKGNRTKALTPVLPKDIRDFARQDAEARKADLTGEAKYNEEDLIQQNRRQFRGLLQVLSDFNSNALEGEDWFFLKGHYRRALGGWIQANGYTVEQLQNDPALLEKGRAYAIQEAQKATYRDFNGLAKKLNDLTRNPETTGQKVLAFGVEAVLPFKKTPANILKRGIEYSPVGIARSIVDAATGLRQYNRYMRGELDTMPENAKTPNEVIDEFCAGLTGTAIMTMGAMLGSLGAVSCGFDDDDDEFERLKGGQEYAINPGKAGNAILGMFGIPKLFGEDVTFTLDWAAPMCMPFFVGAAVQEQAVNQEGFSIDELINAFGNITEPVFNLSMLDGVNSLLDMFVAGDDPNTTLTQLGAKVASNYVTSYYPSVFGAAARTFFDDTRRKAFVESGKGSGILGTFRYALEQTQNKIPVWSRDNIPYRDVWGNPEKSGLLERILENFVLPGYINQYKDDPIVNELAQVGRVPKEPPKTFTANNTKYVLTDKQWDTYKTTRGQTAYNLLGELMNTPEYQSASLEERGTLIDGIWDYANKVGKETVFPELRSEEAEPDTNPVQSILDKRKKKNTDKQVQANKKNMITALNSNDLEGFNAMVQALRDDGVSDKAIKDKIGDTYRDQYKDAYRSGDYSRMDEIESLLISTGFEFNTESWEKAVDREKTVESSYDTTGQYGRGNIDLNNRIVVRNDDGSISTEQSLSFYDEDVGKEVLIPTVINGKIVSEDEAIDHYYETGEYLGMFDTPKEADEYAEMLHKRQDWYYNR